MAVEHKRLFNSVLAYRHNCGGVCADKSNNETGQLEGFEDVKGYAKFKKRFWENALTKPLQWVIIKAEVAEKLLNIQNIFMKKMAR